jgi:hypothetical protein
MSRRHIVSRSFSETALSVRLFDAIAQFLQKSMQRFGQRLSEVVSRPDSFAEFCANGGRF